MKLARSYAILTIILIIGLGGAGCRQASSPDATSAPTLEMVAAVPNEPTVDATGTFAVNIIQDMLSATYTPSPTSVPTATPTSDLAATQTMEAIILATAVAATLTAQPTATPNLAATQTKQAADMETDVAATLTAQPTATPTPLPPSTATLPPPLPTATSTPARVSLDMIVIPAGEFVMGSNAADNELTLQECNQTEGNCQATWFDGEIPARALNLPEFRISQYEVTNSQYNICVANGVCPPIGRIAPETDIAYDPNFFADPLPAVAVSWDNANIFCRWAGARLPGEEEWEKAARGTDGSRRYPWGYTFEAGRANLSSGFPTAVGSYPGGASPYGVMDMAGNVFEWTATATGDGRYILRGGAWSKFYFRGRVADRGTKLAPNFVNYDIGFRCAQ